MGPEKTGANFGYRPENTHAIFSPQTVSVEFYFATFIATNQSMIRNIIFDYGGVIIDLDFNRPKFEFEKLGVKNFDQHFTEMKQSNLFDDLDKGEITEREFREKLRSQLNMPLSDEEIDAAWNSMIIGIREEKIQLLAELYADNYQCYLLSNTNFIHLKYLTKHLLKTYGRFNLDEYFNKVYYSCVVRLRKPEESIFRKVIEDNDLKPSETLYIDDSPQHIEGAKTFQLQTLLYNPAQSLHEAIAPWIKGSQDSTAKNPFVADAAG